MSGLSNDSDGNYLINGSSPRHKVTIGYQSILAMTSASADAPGKWNPQRPDRKMSNGKLEQGPIRTLNEFKDMNECKKIYLGEDVTAIA